MGIVVTTDSRGRLTLPGVGKAKRQYLATDLGDGGWSIEPVIVMSKAEHERLTGNQTDVTLPRPARRAV